MTPGLAIFSAGGLTVSFAARDDADTKDHAEFGTAKAHPVQGQAKLAALKQLWDADAAAENSRGSIFRNAEEVHLWSRRLLEAERALVETPHDDRAAVLGHWQRMEQVYRKVKALFDTGTKGGETERAAAAKYYRAEAELWLVEAGGAVPEDRLP